VLSLGAGAQVLFSDDFNRPDSSNLGPSWTQVAGSSIGISGGAAIATTHDWPLAIVNGISVGYQDAVLTVDALHAAAGSLDYVALVYGYKDNDHCLFVKVQQQGANQYNYAAFFYGNNGAGDFFSLSTPFDSARIGTWALDADTIRLGIDTNFDGVWDQTYDYAGVSSLTLGTGVGLGMYSSNSDRGVRADKYVVSGKSAGHGDVPEPSTVVFAVGAVLGGVLLRRRK
jgi:hypothetical protein